MKPALFDYYCPDTLEEAVALLQRLEAEDIDAKILAGGQSLMPMLNLRMARPDAVVDLGKLACLDYIRDLGEVIAIGAMTTKATAEDSELIQKCQPLFHEATRCIGHRAIRNRGTVGGSFAHADPAAEYGAVAMVLGLEMTVLGSDGERNITADDFYITFLTADIEATEILTEVRLPPLADGVGWSFQEMARRHGDLALAGAAVTMRLDGGVCCDVRIAIFGINATASRMTDAEKFMTGKAPDADICEEAGRQAARSVATPIADVHASAEYRRSLVETYVSRCLAEAASRAT